MRRFFFIVGCMVLLICLGVSTQATIIQFEHIFEFSGAADPQGPSPWLTTTFDDGGTPGTVTVTLENTNLIDTEFVRMWYLNVVESLDPDTLNFGTPSKTGTFTDPTIDTETDNFKADGDGFFDIYFDFAVGGGDSARFGVGESITLTIDDGATGTLVASDFDAQSAMGGGAGAYPVAAHVQGIVGGNSGWVSTPEPASVALLGLGTLLLLRTRRR